MEEWRDIEGYEGLYQVSSQGRVKRNDSFILFNGTIAKRKGRILKSTKYNGYEKVPLSKNGIVKHFQVHRLVAIAFLPNPNDYPCVNHKDENPSNNSVSNLEWCDVKYNVNYGTAIMRRRKKQSRGVLQIKNGVVINEFISANDVKKQLGYNHSRILKVCNGLSKIAYGYEWKWAS